MKCLNRTNAKSVQPLPNDNMNSTKDKHFGTKFSNTNSTAHSEIAKNTY